MRPWTCTFNNALAFIRREFTHFWFWLFRLRLHFFWLFVWVVLFRLFFHRWIRVVFFTACSIYEALTLWRKVVAILLFIMSSWCLFRLVWMIKFTCWVLIRTVGAKFAIFCWIWFGRRFLWFWYFFLTFILVWVNSFASSSLACTVKTLWAFILRLIWRFAGLCFFRSVLLGFILRFYFLKLLLMNFLACGIHVWAH